MENHKLNHINTKCGGGIQGVPIQGSEHPGWNVDKWSVSVWCKLKNKKYSFALDKPLSGLAVAPSFT